MTMTRPPVKNSLARSRVKSLARDRRLWLVGLAIIVILGVHLSGVGEALSLEALRAHRQALLGLVEGNFALATGLYLVVYVAATALSVPGAAILTLAGGFLFGAVYGTFLTVIAASTGATLVFLFARYLTGERALDRFGAQATRLAEGLRRNAWAYLLALRLVPLFPFFLVNLVPAIVGVRLPVYVLTTVLGIIPGTAVYSLAGAGLGSVFDRGEAFSVGAVLTPEIVAALFGLALLALIAIPIRNRFAPAEPPQ
jgi:uncharacterized membrane protein YdjX (TVP38/TMEM64 family)